MAKIAGLLQIAGMALVPTGRIKSKETLILSYKALFN
jgi:hypothetical protein